MESSPGYAAKARTKGWKLYSHQDPLETPASLWDGWFLLDDNFGRVKSEPLELDK